MMRRALYAVAALALLTNPAWAGDLYDLGAAFYDQVVATYAILLFDQAGLRALCF